MNKDDNKGPVLITAMRGLPRSGKSTVAKRISSRFGYPIVSRDAIRLALHGQAYVESLEDQVSYIEENMLVALAYAGHKSIIIDECNCDAVKSEKKIKSYFEGTTFEVEIQFAVIDTPTSVCRERAVTDQQEYLLPVIDRMAMAWTL